MKKAAKPPQPKKKKNSLSETEKKKNSGSETEKKKPAPPKKSDPYYEMETENLNVRCVLDLLSDLC